MCASIALRTFIVPGDVSMFFWTKRQVVVVFVLIIVFGVLAVLNNPIYDLWFDRGFGALVVFLGILALIDILWP